jgi:hypothetical protein
MWWYADSAQNWFATHHMYPTSLDKWAKNENSFSFTNPFTKKHDQTILIALDKLTTDPSGIDRDKGCAVAPSWRPGGIYCVSLNDLKFVVHGFDRNGAPLTSTDADKYFVIECRNGINLTRQKLNDQASAKELKENVRTKVFVCSSSEQELLVRQIRVMSCICLWAGTIISALWCLIAFRLQQPKVVLVLSLLTTVGCSLLLISWYVLGYGMIPTGV